MNIVALAPFAVAPKATVSVRLLPLAASLVRRGHSVTVLVPPYDRPVDGGRVYDVGGVRVENLKPESWLGARGQWSLARRLARRCRELRPDAVFAFKPVGPGALAMALAYLRGERRIVVDNDDWEGSGGWADVNPYPALQRRFLIWQERWCLSRAAGVTCASDTLMDRTRAFRQPPVGPGPDRLLLVPNGPDLALRQPIEHAQAARDACRARLGWGAETVLIYAGTVPLNHDLDLALSAAGRALDAGHRIRLAFVVAGDGVESLRRSVLGLSRLAAVTEFHDFVPRVELVQWLVAADLALYPYRDSNINRAKCSGKVIDYMSCGLPMVLSDVGMNRRYVEDGVSGMLTAPGDAGAFWAALERLLADPAAARRMGRAAQHRIWADFSWDAAAADVEQLLSRVASVG